MVRVICILHSSTAGFKLTKLFGIYDFSVEKDSGKVLIIIIYCFYNYYHTIHPTCSHETVTDCDGRHGKQLSRHGKVNKQLGGSLTHLPDSCVKKR